MTSTSPGHDHSADLELIDRVERARAHDRRIGRICKAAGKWALILAVPIVLATGLLPRSLGLQCRSKQSEAKGNLRALYVAEESYRAELGRYTVDPDGLGFAAKGSRIRYDYFVRAEAGSFQAFAVGVEDDVAGDLWRIDERNALEHVVNACR